MQAITTSTLQKEGLPIGDVAAQYKYNNAVIDFEVDTLSNVCSSLKHLCHLCLLCYTCSISVLRPLLFLRSCLLLVTRPPFLFQIAGTLTLDDILPSTKLIASIKLPDYDSGKVHLIIH